jgi:hypothetical protein
MACESYAIYLLDDAARSSETDGEAFYWFEQALLMANTHVTGNTHTHTIKTLNNFGVVCLSRRK